MNIPDAQFHYISQSMTLGWQIKLLTSMTTLKLVVVGKVRQQNFLLWHSIHYYLGRQYCKIVRCNERMFITLKSRNFNLRAYIWSHLHHLLWKFKSWAGKLLKFWGSNPRSGRSIFFVLFLFIFKSSIKNCISLL